MFRFPKSAAPLAVAIVTSAFAGCAPLTVSSQFDRAADFAQYRTFQWGPADALPTSDPRLDQNAFFRDHLEGAVEKHLASRGWTLASSDTPDILIHYHANVRQRIDVNRIDQQYGSCYATDCDIRVMEYEAGTLVLDFVDARTNRVVWRGWAQNSMNGIFDHPDRMERMINEAVERMLARLPRTL